MNSAEWPSDSLWVEVGTGVIGSRDSACTGGSSVVETGVGCTSPDDGDPEVSLVCADGDAVVSASGNSSCNVSDYGIGGAASCSWFGFTVTA